MSDNYNNARGTPASLTESLGDSTDWSIVDIDSLPEIPDNSRRGGCKMTRRMVTQYALFAILFTLGMVGTHFSDAGPLSTRILGAILFVGGLIPIVTTLSDALVAEESLLTLKQPKNGLSCLIFVLGMLLLWPAPDDGWLAAFGVPLLEGAVIHIIYRCLFIDEDETS